MNPQTCNKFGANRYRRLVDDFPDFCIFDPLNPPPQVPPLGLEELMFLAYVHSPMNPHMCAKFGANRSSHLADFQTF